MADTIGAIGIPITADESGLARGVQNATQYLSTFGGFVKNMAAGDATAGLTSIGSAVQSLASHIPGVSTLGSAFQALTSPIGMVAAALTGTYYAATKAISSIARLQNEAKALGASVEGAQKFNYALASFGASGEDVQSVLDKLRAKLGDLASGDAAATAAFQRLGLSMQQLQGLSLPEQFALIGDRLKAQGDSTIRASIAMDIFGKQWASVENLAMKGSEKFREAGRQAERFGIILTDSQVAAMKKLADGGKQVTAAWGTIGTFFKNQIALMTAPIVEAMQPVLMQAREAMQPFLDAAGGVMRGFGSIVGAAARIASNVVGPIISGVGWVLGRVSAIGDVIGKVLSPVLKGFDQLGRAAGNILENISSRVSTLVAALTTIPNRPQQSPTSILLGPGTLEGKITALLSGSADAIGKMNEQQQATVAGQVSGIQGIVTSMGVLANFPQILDAIVPGLQGIATSATYAAGAMSEFDRQTMAIWNSMSTGPSVSSATSDSIIKTTESLREQAQTFGMSQREIDRWRLSMQLADQGLSQSQIDDELAELDFFMETLSERQLDADIRKQNDALTEQIATFGMSAEQIALWRLEQRDAGGAATGLTAVLTRELEQLKENQEAMRVMEDQFRQMQQAGQAMAESFKSPLQAWEDGLANAQELFLMGAIDLDTYDLQIKKLTDDLLATSEIKLPQSPTAVTAGSSAGISAVLAARRQAESDRPTDPMERLRQVQEQQRQLQQRQLEEARRMRELLENSGEIAIFGLS